MYIYTYTYHTHTPLFVRLAIEQIVKEGSTIHTNLKPPFANSNPVHALTSFGYCWLQQMTEVEIRQSNDWLVILYCP